MNSSEVRPEKFFIQILITRSLSPRSDSIYPRFAVISVGYVITPTHGIIVCRTSTIYDEAFINTPVVSLFARTKRYEKKE
jgi:hypothetical protein